MYERRARIFFQSKNVIYTVLAGAYAGFLRGGGPTFKFLGFWIYMPRSGMSRAAKLRAFLGGFGGMSPQENC